MRALLILFVMAAHLLNAQKEGDQWVMGFYGQGSQEFSIINLDFRSGNLEITLRYDHEMKIRGTASNICNSAGELVLWTNGMEIFGRNGEKIADTIAYSGAGAEYWQQYYSDFYNKPDGFPLVEGAIILTVPDREDTYSVIYHSAEKRPGILYKIPRFLEARIHVETDSSYTLIYKDSIVGEYREWYSNRIEAVKHGNGRDWWILIFEENTGQYFSYILDPDGIRLFNSGETATVLSSFGAMSSFSPYGNYFARMDAPGNGDVQYLTLYTFDRCSGSLEILETMRAEGGAYTAPSFSPSERYLYGNNRDSLWQWDLWAEDINSTQALVGIYDGFDPPVHFGTVFGPQLLGPDGRIYIIPPGTTEYVHVINRPNLPADECTFLQHHIDLTVPNTRTAPNIPNFRLGPMDGSPCDTLGIDNVPVAKWRFEQDEPGWHKKIRFTDLSFYNPQEWHWDFGDGQSSDQVSPVYTYDQDGMYDVCLTVSNENGSDTECHVVEILTTSLQEAEDNDGDVLISPNPFIDQLKINTGSGTFRSASLQVFNMHGKEVLNQAAIPIPSTLNMPHLPSGMYLINIQEKGGKTYSFQVMKI